MSKFADTYAPVFMSLFLVVDPMSAYGQRISEDSEDSSLSLSIDLAGSSTQEHTVAPRTYSLELRNTLPGLGHKYRVFLGPVVAMEQPELTVDASGPFTWALDDNCAANATAVLQNATDESEIPDLARKAHQALRACDGDFVRQVDLHNDISVTKETPVTVPAGSRTIVTIVRDSKEWEITLSSVGQGRWQMMYGIAFAPNGDQEYFARPEGDEGFLVTKERPPDKGSLVSLPSVFWTWLPPDQAFGALQHGFTAGIGVSTARLGHTALLMGYAVRYNQNLGAVIGAALHPKKRLDGRYVLDEVLVEKISGNELNQDEIRLNFFFGAIFRFGANR